MFIQLNEWYYHSSMCGYQTRPLAINVDEISDFQEYKMEDVGYVSLIALKNGRTHCVKESYKKIWEAITG